MHWIDVGILAVIAISSVISMTRGFVREALSLAGWVAAFWIALSFSQQLADLILINYISTPSVRIIIAFVSLFFITIILTAMINSVTSRVVRKTGLSGTDRVIGIGFGMVRGVVIVGILVLLASLTNLPQDVWWRESALIGHFQQLAMWVGSDLVPRVTANFAYK